MERDFLNQIDQATLEGKPIFIDFYTKWCGPCRNMDRDVFTVGAAGAYFNKHGKEYKRIVGISSASKLIKTGKETCQTH